MVLWKIAGAAEMPEVHRQSQSAPKGVWVLQGMRQQILQRGESAKKFWSAGRPVMASGDSVQLRAWRARRRAARAASSVRLNCVTGYKSMCRTWLGKLLAFFRPMWPHLLWGRAENAPHRRSNSMWMGQTGPWLRSSGLTCCGLLVAEIFTLIASCCDVRCRARVYV